jgi:hypothetical protein
VEAVIARAAEVMQEEPDAYATQREHLASEAQRLSEAIKNLTVAVESGACLAPLVEALKDRQRERADVLARLEHLEGLATAVTWDEDTLTELRARLVEWDGLLSSEPVMARQILRKLLEGRLTMTPKVTPEGRFYEVSGLATYGRIINGMLRVQSVVPPG